MDPILPGTEDNGQALSRRPPRDPLTADFAPSGPVPARTTRLVCGDFLLTVNPVDGSEIEPCPPHERPAAPAKRTPAARAEYERAALPPAPPGHRVAATELLERQEIRERLVRLLTQGRTVRLTGPGGSGRTALLDLVAEDCADLAPDGVVRLDGLHRTPDDLLRDLFHTVHDAPRHRLEADELRESVKEIGAVVLIDDLEFGGTALTELLEAAPECAFLLAATPDTPAATGDIEEVGLPGLDRAAGVEILERSVGRDLTEEEAVWAGDLWFESEGLPLRFVQAGALLRQREQLRASGGVVDEYGVFEDVRGPADAVLDLPLEDEEAEEVPLPSLAEAAAPAPLLASRLSTSARAALRFAVALDGELPHPAHLPALVGDTHADAALGELLGCGLVSPAGPRYRLAAGVRAQLEAAGYDEDAPAEARTAARHYAWWAAHPSVTPERVCAEAAAVLTALETVLPGTEPADGGEDEQATAVRLAHAASAAFAAGLHWTAWEQALHAGSEAARLAQDVPERAYFHHELGILALIDGQLDRARSELEVSHGMRSALSDMRGTVAGRRALALVADRSGDLPGLAALMAAEEPAPARTAPLAPAPAAFTPSHGYGQETVVARQSGAAKERSGVRAIARRNLVAAGSGALLVAVLGTVVTLGMTSDEGVGRNPASNVGGNPTATQDLDDGTLGAVPKRDEPAPADAVTTRPTGPGPDGTPGTADDPSPSATTGSPTADPTGTQGSGGGTSPEPTRGGGSSGPTGKPTGKPSTSPSDPDPTTSGEPSETGEPSTPDSPSTPPTTSTSASRPAGSATASAPASTEATETAGTPVSASTEPPVI
ncbi:ATP-binding protein [Streptomyces bauhiniae]|uniref:ATP-binding protein n=1 Tax=Streptomyces bauhiniae TaxID=2340725 RepID=A0A7K3QYZ1_9ACTN|nr:ATP-binding protein [Streptomyces bauhiniae]NEB95046.1 ATP-binding protein [Streptomyces bauhiniae]